MTAARPSCATNTAMSRPAGPCLDSWTSAGLALTVNIAGLTNGTEYNFEVRAVNDQGDGTAATDSATPATVPLAPTLTATPGYRQITLSWTAPTDDGGAAVTGYRIEIFRNGAYVPLTTPGRGPTPAYNHTGLSDNTNYAYQIIATNAAGDSPPGTATATTVLSSPSAPSAPLAGNAPVPGAGMVTISWSAPAFNSQTVTQYQYRYAVEGAAFSSWRNADPGPSVRTAVVKDLTPGERYRFEVRARNTAGVSEESLAITERKQAKCLSLRRETPSRQPRRLLA